MAPTTCEIEAHTTSVVFSRSFDFVCQGCSTGEMASSGGAGSGSGAGAAGQDDNQCRRSKRPKKDEADKDKWQRAKEMAYEYRPDRKFDPVDRPEAPAPVGGYQKPPILVFFNAKGGTLKTSHTWNTACTMSSVLRGLKVCTRFGLVIGFTSMPAQHRCRSTYIARWAGGAFGKHGVER